MMPASYPARQRNRRLAHGARDVLLASATFLLAGAATRAGSSAIALTTFAVGLAFSLRSWHSFRLARRSSIGARSEQRVRAELGALEREGWRIRHSLRWTGGGDIDHIAIAPRHVQMAFAIETKTRTYRQGDLARVAAVAHWLVRRRPSWCRHGAVPILCLAGTHGVERWEEEVVVVSAERLVPVLSRLAGTTAKPRFLR
jgi:hypothetical protein